MAYAVAKDGTRSRQSDKKQGSFDAPLQILFGAAHKQDEVWLWPENIESWQRWNALQTQWRVGMAGATGMDYAGVSAFLSTGEGLQGEDLRKAFRDMQACEFATLKAWNEARD